MKNNNPFPALTEENLHNSALVETSSQREVAEVQAAMILAKKFPRDQRACYDQIMIACQRPGLAQDALYSYSRGGADITGPSIRLAEAIAQNWKNVQFGIREVDQREGESTVEAYAWDIENNIRQSKTFQVRHFRSTRSGGYDLKDPRDIYELVANNGARRLRACILGILPGDVVEDAVRQCENTIKAEADLSPAGLKKMVDKFAEIGISKEQIEARIQRKIESITASQVVALRKIFKSIEDGMSYVGDWFETVPQANKGDLVDIPSDDQKTEGKQLKPSTTSQPREKTSEENTVVPNF